MYRDDGEAARQRSEALEQELREARHDAPDSITTRMRVLEEELAALRAQLEARARHAGELMARLSSLRRTDGLGFDDPPPRAPTRTVLAVALTVVLVVALFGIFVVSVSVAGDALRIFTRGTSAKHSAAAPPLTERDIPGFPARVDVDAAIYGVLGDFPGARPIGIDASGVGADGFADLSDGTGNAIALRLVDARGRIVDVTVDGRGLWRTDAPGDALPGAELPLCTTRMLWDRAIAAGAFDVEPASIVFDASNPATPWTFDVAAPAVWRFGPDCTVRPERVLGDFVVPEHAPAPDEARRRVRHYVASPRDGLDLSR